MTMLATAVPELSDEQSGLECRDVSFTWNAGSVRETAVLEHVSCHIVPGEIVTIVGPTGCGKSTLLRLLMGLAEPDEGEVKLDGSVVTGPSTRVGVIFQDHGLFPWLGVRENVEFGLRMRGVGHVECRRRSREVLDAVGLGTDGDRHIDELSGGMKRRVGIARMLANDADYLLMDEPFEALDYETRFRMQQFLLHVHGKFGKTVVLVSHQIDEAIILSDRILLMSARPSHFVEELTVQLERPRDPTGPEFNTYRTIIRRHLEGEVARQFRNE